MSQGSPLAPEPGTSPLLETSPRALLVLMSAEPASLTDAELEVIVKEHRAQRSRIQAAEAAGKPRRAAKAPIGASPAKDVTLDELDL